MRFLHHLPRNTNFLRILDNSEWCTASERSHQGAKTEARIGSASIVCFFLGRLATTGRRIITGEASPSFRGMVAAIDAPNWEFDLLAQTSDLQILDSTGAASFGPV